MKINYVQHLLTEIVLFAFFLLLNYTVSAQRRQDSIDVAATVNGVTNYSLKNQMDSFGILFDQNATFITTAGLVAKGRDKIIDMHALGKYIMDSSTSVKLEPPVVNFINKDLAIAYSVWQGLVFKIRGEKGPMQSGYLTCVLLREKDGWKIISATNATNGSFEPSLKFTEYSHDMWKMLGIEE